MIRVPARADLASEADPLADLGDPEPARRDLRRQAREIHHDPVAAEPVRTDPHVEAGRVRAELTQGERVVGTAQFEGTELMTVANLHKMEVMVDVNENDIIRVSMGDTAIIDVDSYTHTGQTFKGVVTNIANTANQKVSPDAVTEFEVRILIMNESYEKLRREQSTVTPFRPGMTATADIVVKKLENVLLVPNAALRFTPPLEKKSS